MSVAPIKPRDIRGWQWVRDVVTADPSLTIGARILAIREALRWSQEELGARIGVHQNAVSVWEQGKNEPQAVYVYRLAQTFRCTMDGLYSGDRPWTPIAAGPSQMAAPQCEGIGTRGRCKRRVRGETTFCRWHLGTLA